MSKFKVGDEVKIVDPILDEQRECIGEVHIVTRTCDTGVYLSTLSDRDDFYFDEELELYNVDLYLEPYISHNSLKDIIEYETYPTKLDKKYIEGIWESKEENKMRNEVLELWYSREINKIDEKYGKLVNEYVEKHYDIKKAYDNLIKEFEEDLEILYKEDKDNNESENTLLKENNTCNVFKYVIDVDRLKYEALEIYRDKKDEEIGKILNTKKEINALLSMSNDLEYQQSILIEYGIIDKKTKRMI